MSADLGIATRWESVAVEAFGRTETMRLLNSEGLLIGGRDPVTMSTDESWEGLRGARIVRRDGRHVGYLRAEMSGTEAARHFRLELELASWCDAAAWQGALTLAVEAVLHRDPADKVSVRVVDDPRAPAAVDGALAAGLVCEGRLPGVRFLRGARASVAQFSTPVEGSGEGADAGEAIAP